MSVVLITDPRQFRALDMPFMVLLDGHAVLSPCELARPVTLGGGGRKPETFEGVRSTAAMLVPLGISGNCVIRDSLALSLRPGIAKLMSLITHMKRPLASLLL